MRFPLFVLAAFGLVASTLFPVQSYADTFSVNYLAAGAQTSSASNHVNTFESGTFNPVTGTTTFSGSGITGTYSGSYSVMPANVYGGAGGSGNYIATAGTYSLTLSSAVNYFGLWFSALDQGNQLSFYNGNTLLYTFTPAAYQSLIGTCNGSNAYCGNPNAAFQGQDSGEQFAFLNLYDSNGSFNKIVFTESPAAGAFESDNHTIGTLSSAPLGTAIVTPEPPSLLLALTGIGVIFLTSAVRRSIV